MSCNGCRVLRKGCNEKCILRQSLSGIESSQAQSNATVFVAKFFGRAGLMSFLSAVPDSQRPALFQSLLFEACGRTINPVSGAVGLLWTGNWNVCQSAVESVLRGGLIQAIPQFTGESPPLNSTNNESKHAKINGQDLFPQRPVTVDTDLDLYITPKRQRVTGGDRAGRAGTPNSDESDTTTFESGLVGPGFDEKQIVGGENKLLRLFF